MSTGGEIEAPIAKLLIELRRSAMDLLARREHSRAELAQKLQRKYPEASQHFDEVLDQLEQDGLLDDERFAEAYVRYRRSRGFGPLLIRQELRSKGVEAGLLDAVLDPGAEDWLDTLRELIRKKERLSPSDSEPGSRPDADNIRRARQKLYRFCLSRGFTSDQVSQAMR